MWARLERALFQVVAGDIGAADSTLDEVRRNLESRRTAGDTSLSIPDTLLIIAAAKNDRAAVDREAEMLLRTTANDLWRLPESEANVARAYAILGDAERAIPHIERALSMPSQEGLTPAYLRLDPVWDRIRADARFGDLLARYR